MTKALRVTSLRELPGNKVAVSLDGKAWRTLPTDVTVRAGLRVGVMVDRPRAREVARERRRARALGVAARALTHRDLSREELARRLDQPGLGGARAEAMTAVEAAGLLDDRRFAASRAAALARRGYGNEAIRADLEQRGVEAGVAGEAVAALRPEAARALAVVEKLGPGAAAARRLASRGFGADVVEAALADLVADEQGSE